MHTAPDRPNASRTALIYTILIIVVMAVFAIVLTAYISRQLEKRTEDGLSQRVDLLVGTMASYNAALSESTKKIATVFQSYFHAEFSLDPTRSIVIEDAKTPLLKNGPVILNGNNSIVDRFTVITKSVGTVFVRSEDNFIRISTSLKKGDGSRAIGTMLERDHPAYAGLLQGIGYVGKAELFGKDYMTSYQPVKDSKGNVIAVLFVGLDFSDNLKGLKDKIRTTKIGQSGYIYVLDAKEGLDYGKLQIHPAKEGSNLVDSKDSKGHAFIREILGKKHGVIRYPWANEELGDTRAREKLVAYQLFKEWNWIICAGSWLDELNSEARTFRNAMFGATAIVSLILVLLFRTMLHMKNQLTKELQLRIDQYQESQEELQATEEMLREQVDEGLNTHDQLLATEEMLRFHLLEAEESSKKFMAVFENSPVAVMLTTIPDGTFYEVNRACLNLFGYNPDEVIGKTAVDLALWQSAEDRNCYVKLLQDNGSAQNLEAKMKHRGGGEITAFLSGTMLKLSDKTFALSTVIDITEQKRLQSQLQQAQKMESVGRLAGGVAHDFNNLLGVIIGYAELALMRMDPLHPHYSAMIEIRSAADRSADLTRQLLAFARQQTIAPRVIDLNETVSGMLKILQRLIGEDIRLTWQPAPDLWQVKADPSQVDQILANLCVNARDAITDVGKVSIETGNCTIDANYCAAHTETVPGEYVRLAVSDNGSGMDKETVIHIFEPFYTTKDLGKGTGLGLATVHGIVRQNNGFINVYSEPEQGTTFTIYLLRHIGGSELALNDRSVEPIPRGNETILLVEDEPVILKMAALMLEGLGYNVLKADNFKDAISLSGEQISTIHLLITDVVMPEMNGRDLANKLQLLNPHLKCLFMSGYTADIIANKGVLDDGVHFIQKPFSLLNLAAKVREVLNSK
jgi:PAS domain S-box-containing protein